MNAIARTLKRLRGMQAVLHLRSGRSLQGTVVESDADSVCLTWAGGQALVKIDAVDGVET